MSSSRVGLSFFLVFVLLLSLSSPSMALASSSQASSDVAVIGCGVLGTSLCKQILEASDFSSRNVVGITKTTNRHESILDQVGRSNRFQVTTAEDLGGRKFKDVVFCAPPSGFDDYSAAVQDAITNVWAGQKDGGAFVFTSSGGIYGNAQGGGVVNESSPTADLETNPRVGRLVKAEGICLENGGCCIRLAGLYTLERGAHGYWLKQEGKEIAGRPDGIVNLLHYDDAASSCLAALRAGPSVVKSKIFLVSDGNPTTRLGICESALKAKMFSGKPMPAFKGGDSDPMGKVYDGSVTNEALSWSPQFPSFDEFMASHS